jgi:hypothetical protein
VNLPFIVLFLAALVHVSAYLLLARRIEPFMYNFYIVAWWSYIAMADAALALKSKRFLVFNRNLPFLVVLSAAFWCVFELINLRIRNWYYINIPSIGLIRFVGYLLAYGTVIPGIYVTKEAFSTLLGSIRVRPLSCSRLRPASCMALGLLLFVILMFFPSQFFFLAWIFLIPIIEGYSYAKGRWCFMGDLERGEAGNLISSVLSGLVCGLLWETWNYWAISKWVYSIPSFETFKLFEMPILGYFGFVFFSLETILFVSFIHESQLVRRHRSWTAIIALTFSLASFAAIDRYTVFSYTATVDQLSFLPQYEREELKRKGIETSFAIDPQQLNQQEKASLALLHLKGLGPANLEKLRQRGIKSVPELARMTEEELSNAIGEKNKRRLRVYLRAARQYRPQ